MLFTVTARSFRFLSARLVVGIRVWPNARLLLLPRRQTTRVFVGRLPRCSISRATRVGDESPKGLAKIHFSAPPSLLLACAAFKEPITAPRTRFSRARNTGLRMVLPKADAITTLRIFPKTR